MTRLYDNLRRTVEDFPAATVLSVDNVSEYIYDKYEPYNESWKSAPTLAPMLNPLFIETLKPKNAPKALPNKWGALFKWESDNLKTRFQGKLVPAGMPRDLVNSLWDQYWHNAHWLMEYQLSISIDGRIYADDFIGICALDKSGKYIGNTHISACIGNGYFAQKQHEWVKRSSGKTFDEIEKGQRDGLIPKPYMGKQPSHASEGDQLDALIHPMLTALLMGLTLAHCKNVELVSQEPPDKLSNRAMKHYGKHLIKYHILKVNPLRTVVHVDGGEDNPEKSKESHSKPLTIFRGHFKDFRDGKGLFGKYKEIYWWDQHVRGNEENGVVIKDYAVTEPVAEVSA